MHRLKLIGLLCCLVVTQIKAQKIPFRLTKHNNIIVKAIINDKDSLDLMFQIAMKEGSIAPEKNKKATSLKFNSDEMSFNNSVRVGPVLLEKILFFDNEYTGHEAEGKIGTDLVGNKIFKIDYDKDEFVLYNKLPKIKGFTSIPLVIKNGQIFVEAENSFNGKTYTDQFLLQSGYSGPIIFSNAFSEQRNLDGNLQVTGEKELKNSAGQKVITKNGILPKFKIAKFELEDVAAGYFAGELKTQKVSYFGADLLKRFIWIFDLKNNVAYIKPSKYYKDPYYKIN